MTISRVRPAKHTSKIAPIAPSEWETAPLLITRHSERSSPTFFLPGSLLRSKIPTLSETGRPAQRGISLLPSLPSPAAPKFVLAHNPGPHPGLLCNRMDIQQWYAQSTHQGYLRRA